MFMPVFYLIIIGLCLSFILGRGGAKRPWAPGPESETSLDILKKRQVKGEISEEEYEGVKQDILN
jgi:uncharacterized membrane protein